MCFTAITIVAMGTSLPDTLGARTVTRMERTADGCVIHIMGSIAVNVLAGVGLPWFVAVMYHHSQVDKISLSFIYFLFIYLLVLFKANPEILFDIYTLSEGGQGKQPFINLFHFEQVFFLLSGEESFFPVNYSLWE